VTVHPCAVSINKPLLVGGIERRLLGVSLIVSAVVGANGSRIVGFLLFFALMVVAKKLTRKDDRMFQIAPFIWRQRAHYDPIKRGAFELTIIEERTEGE